MEEVVEEAAQVPVIVPEIVKESTEAVAEAAQEAAEVAQEVVQGRLAALKERFGSAFSWMGTKATGAKDKVVAAAIVAKDKVASTGKNLWNKVPSTGDFAAVFALKNIKAKIKHLPTAIRNNKCKTAAIVAVPVAMVVAWKLWKNYKAENKKCAARKRVA